MSVGEMSVDEMSEDKMSTDEMSVDEISVDELMLSSSFRWHPIHICERCDIGSHFVLLLKSDLVVQQIHHSLSQCL